MADIEELAALAHLKVPDGGGIFHTAIVHDRHGMSEWGDPGCVTPIRQDPYHL